MDCTNFDTGSRSNGDRGSSCEGRRWAGRRQAPRPTPDNGGFDFVAQPAGGWIIEATGQIPLEGRPLS
jgi:hypothetical protein